MYKIYRLLLDKLHPLLGFFLKIIHLLSVVDPNTESPSSMETGAVGGPQVSLGAGELRVIKVCN
jgi:hypothetical protein